METGERRLSLTASHKKMLSGLLSQGQSLIEVMDEQGFGQADLLMFFSLLGFNADLEELRFVAASEGEERRG